MRKACLLFACLLILPVFASAKNPGIGFGLKAGVDYSKFLMSFKKAFSPSPQEYRWVRGFHIGGGLSVALTETISFNPELIFSQQGSEWQFKLTELRIVEPNDPFFVEDLHGEFQESIILLPLLFRVQPGDRFSVEAGSQFGLLVHQALTGDLSGYSDKTSSLRLSACLGVGYRVLGNARVGLRYSIGLIRRYYVYKEYSSFLQFGVEYQIPKGQTF